MLTNIVDHRKNRYQWKSVYGVIEPTKNDNSIEGADECAYDGFQDVVFSDGPKPLGELIKWVQGYRKGFGNFTLYIYSEDPSRAAKINKEVFDMVYEVDLEETLENNRKKGIEGFTDIQNLMLNMMGGLKYEDLTPEEKELYDREIGQK